MQWKYTFKTKGYDVLGNGLSVMTDNKRFDVWCIVVVKKKKGHRKRVRADIKKFMTSLTLSGASGAAGVTGGDTGGGGEGGAPAGWSALKGKVLAVVKKKKLFVVFSMGKRAGADSEHASFISTFKLR